MNSVTVVSAEKIIDSSIALAPASNVALLDIPALFQQHRAHMLRFVQHYLRNAADAEDVVQNAFMEAMRCAHRFSGLSKPSTWLYGIALNLARDQVRRNCRDMLEFVDDSVLSQFIDDYADPARQLEVRQIVKKVDKFLCGFTPQIRATFEAALEGDATYEDVSVQLGIPIGTVRSRVSRVRASVRAQLG